MKKRFIIIDANALIHRAFHALPPFTTKEGKLVNAVYGFLSILFKVYKELKPDYLALCFDKAEKTFRDEIYEDYKATREKQPDDLYEQFPIIKKFAQAMEIPILEQSGYEADDLIGSLDQKYQQNDLEKIIVTGDLDLLQLVDKDTKVFTLRKGITDTIIYDESAVKERFDGLVPGQIVDYKALKGDPSDNIPGVAGVGEKTAIDLIKKFNSLENLYKEIEKESPLASEIKPGVFKKLKDDKKNAFMSQKLATIITDMELDVKLDQLKLSPIPRTKISQMLLEYEFSSLVNRLPGTEEEKKQVVEETAPKLKNDYTVINNEDEVEKLISLIEKEKQVAISYWSDKSDFMSAELLGCSFSVKNNQAFYVVFKKIVGEGLFAKVEEENQWLTQFKSIFENNSIKKFGHDLKFLYHLLKNEGIDLQGFGFDTKIASYLLNPGSRSHELSALSLNQLKIKKILFEKGQTIDQKQRIEFLNQEADIVFQLKLSLEKEIDQEKLLSVFKDIEMPLIKVLGLMERLGIELDKGFLSKLALKIDKDIDGLTQKIYKEAGEEFNISSPQQLKVILFEKLEISTKGIAKTKTGISTAAPELEKLKNEHSIIELISEYRELMKLKTTYVDALPLLINKKTNRIHASFNQTITATGRLSSSNPNLQNIPIRTELGREIRKAFVAQKGNKLVAADYSQIELRIVASIAQEENMIKAFKANEDIHTTTAALINDCPKEDVTKKMRREAKAVNFGIIYGMGARGLAQSSGITNKEAKEFIEKYFERFPQIKVYVEATKKMARDKGYVETLLKRKRYLPEIHSGVQMLQASAERMAINMPIQGTSADIIKMAMIEIDKGLSNVSKESKMILQVHDELVFEVPENEVKKVAEYIDKTMENIFKIKVPLTVDVSSGENWGELKKL